MQMYTVFSGKYYKFGILANIFVIHVDTSDHFELYCDIAIDNNVL